MSLSDRMPGYRNKSQVPPMASRPSRTAKVLPGQRRRKWMAAPIPARPAPTIITSKDSIAKMNAPVQVQIITIRPASRSGGQQQLTVHVLQYPNVPQRFHHGQNEPVFRNRDLGSTEVRKDHLPG